MIKKIHRWLPLLVLIVLLVLFFSLHLDKYLSFNVLKENHALLIEWTHTHYFIAPLIFIVFYTTAVAISIPGAVLLTLTGGFLFGVFWGVLFVVISATLGATILFFAVRTALGDWLGKKASGWLERMRQGFQHNAFSYLVTLRLIPVFPFWVVNIVPALLNIRAKTFITATFIGIIPGTTIYVMVGNSLSQIFTANQTPNLGIIFELQILGPLLALAVLSLMPVLYQFSTRKHQNRQSFSDISQVIRCDLAIIGGGAGGLSLASGCSQLGLKVVLVESGKMGGDCLNYGCIPSKSLLAAAKTFYYAKHATHFGVHTEAIKVDFQQVMQHVHQVIDNISEHDSVQRFESLGVQVIKQFGRFLNSNTIQAGDSIIKAKRFVIATGSSPFIPPIPGLDTIPYFTNETIFDLKEQPKHLIVIGGGPIGCELSQAFAMLGSKVTLLEGLNLLPKDDPDCVTVLRTQMKSMNILIYEQIKITQICSHPDTGISVCFEFQNTQFTITASHLLIATGRRANVNLLDLEKAGVKFTSKGVEVNKYLQTSNKKIYALGDVTGLYQFTHMASYQAGIALRNIVFKLPAKMDYKAIPWVTYTDPELAHVGLRASDALKHPDIQIIEWPFVDNDRAQTEHTLNGKIKIITDKKARILGVTIVGPHAGELILPWIMAIREKKTLRSFTDAIIPYPTLSEISKRVAGNFYAPKLFSNKTRTLVRWLQKIG
ncbi:FAD-dependent oxidoreductase [Legionella sp. PATHC032]|uniref:FAD-dependent oxidoreductase n=1 Tax=Legionella sp. PATHC032 TaxID=2992039 RepID=UPI001B2BDA25|nr:bifunctional TVP38/TMEM64 family protein/FAD-dependent oxidoreductase [Legionella sp. PATHC032]MCW8421445.1 FAD-dependent oxidoreductase [Legionella sp. PATHC032]HAZ7572618.1 FAD-dependent oxidoreductase [Legionella pneumophila]HBA1633972.1 FAD-dependent oxidoreductase [Legionella pneumophila]